MKIRNILYIATALLIAGCANEELTTANNGTLSGEGKTPLRIETSLSTSAAITRATDQTFAANDELLAYIRHTTGGTLGNYTTEEAHEAPKLVTLKVKEDAIAETSEFVTPIYWDDFSQSTDDGSKDLRTGGHGLQSYYGYCYNGRSPKPTLTEATGELTWTVLTDQKTNTAKTSDLLWSPEQAKVEYAHSTAREGTGIDHGTMTIPYTHAMSEITVTITAAEGFTGNPLTNTSLKLYGMKTTATLTAPTGNITSGDAKAEITMFPNDYASGGQTRSFTAIVAPGTKLLQGEKLLDIVGVDENDYTLTITSSMLTNTAWAKDHSTANPIETGTEEGKTYVLTKSGYNYHLDVTVNKTKVQTHATLADWTIVNASGTGDIVFGANETDETLVMDDTNAGSTEVQVVAVDKNLFANGASFTLFTADETVTNRNSDSYIYRTVSTFVNPDASEANDKWTNNPEIYWPNRKSKYYFRALAKFNSATNGVNSITNIGTDKATAIAVTQGTIAEGKDIIWGTTAMHKGTTTNTEYKRGQAIPPRTGGVPIAFEHAMSKVTFILETSPTTDPNAKVDLSNVHIAISNLYTSGTINLEKGEVDVINSNFTATDAITGSATAASSPAETATPISEYIVVPQGITGDAIVNITLFDSSNSEVARYSLKLQDCVETGTDTKVTQWQRGKHYTYTIHLEKEKIDFRALIKDWNPVYGSGNANLEWD